MDGVLAMDGYTGYLVVAYGVTALVVIGNVVAARRQFNRTRLRLRQQLERRSGRRPVPGSADGAQGPGGAGDRVQDRAGEKGGHGATTGRGS